MRGARRLQPRSGSGIGAGSCFLSRLATMGFRPSLSWVLPVETPTTRGRLFRSDRTCILEPGLPRSTGLGPASSAPFAPAHGPSPRPRARRREGRRRGVCRARPGAAGPGRRPWTRSRTGGGRWTSICRSTAAAPARPAAHQNVDDGRECCLIGRVLRSAALRTDLRRRQQRLGDLS